MHSCGNSAVAVLTAFSAEIPFPMLYRMQNQSIVRRLSWTGTVTVGLHPLQDRTISNFKCRNGIVIFSPIKS